MTVNSVSGAASAAAQAPAGTASGTERAVAVLRKTREQAAEQGAALVGLIRQAGVSATTGRNLDVYA